MPRKEYVPKKKSTREYISRIYLPRISLRPIEVPLSWNPDPNYRTLNEIRGLAKRLSN